MSRRAGVRRALRRAVRRPRVGTIEVPSYGAAVAPGRLEVVGWATLRDRLIRRIEIRIDGQSAGYARPFAAYRPDVSRTRRGPGAQVAGFEHVVVIPDGPARRVRLDVDIVGLDGSHRLLEPVEVEVGATPREAASPPLGPVTATARPHEGRPTRVVAFTNHLGIGGGQLYLQDILRALLVDPAFSVVVISRIDGALRADLEEMGATVHVVEYPVWSAVDYEARVRLLSDVVGYHDPDVVLVNSMPAGIGADIAARSGIPMVWAIHESYTLDDLWVNAYNHDGLAPEVRARLEWALASATLLVFEADATRDVYAPVGAPGRAITIRYGIAFEAIQEYRAAHDRDAVRRSLGLDPTDRAILCMGTFEPRKAQAGIALAFAEIAHEFPDAVLVLVGELDGPYSSGVRAVMERANLAQRLRVEPIVEDPYPWYFAADALISASDVESMPRSMLEAMAFELPVAATSVWGIPELIEHGSNGLLYEPRDMGALRDALRTLLEMPPEEVDRLGAAARDTVARRFDDVGFVEVYRRLLPAVAARPDADPHVLVSGRESVA